VKNDREETIYSISVALLSVLLVLVVILAVEVRYFKTQTQELVRMKEDYSNYTLGLRRTIVEYQRMIRECDSERPDKGAKKKRTR